MSDPLWICSVCKGRFREGDYISAIDFHENERHHIDLADCVKRLLQRIEALEGARR
jgi:hypothetical protein